MIETVLRSADHAVEQQNRAGGRLAATVTDPALIGTLPQTGRLQLAFGALLTLGLAVRF